MHGFKPYLGSTALWEWKMFHSGSRPNWGNSSQARAGYHVKQPRGFCFLCGEAHCENIVISAAVSSLPLTRGTLREEEERDEAHAVSTSRATSAEIRFRISPAPLSDLRLKVT